MNRAVRRGSLGNDALSLICHGRPTVLGRPSQAADSALAEPAERMGLRHCHRGGRASLARKRASGLEVARDEGGERRPCRGGFIERQKVRFPTEDKVQQAGGGNAVHRREHIKQLFAQARPSIRALLGSRGISRK